MFKRNIIPLMYCVLFPLLIGVVLLVLPELYSSVNPEAPIFVRVIRAFMTIWLMLVYIFTGIPFIPNLESSPITFLSTWRRHYNLRDEKNEPRVDRSFFPAYYFLSKLFICVFASLVFLGALSTFTELTLPAKAMIAAVNFFVLFLPHGALYNQVVSAVYGNESQ